MFLSRVRDTKITKTVSILLIPMLLLISVIGYMIGDMGSTSEVLAQLPTDDPSYQPPQVPNFFDILAILWRGATSGSSNDCNKDGNGCDCTTCDCD